MCPGDGASFRAFFEVPRPGVTPTDFLKLPFPNDALVRADGTLDLAGFPRPGPSILGYDVVARFADALSADFAGFSTTAPVQFRFSKQLDLATIGTNGSNVELVDISDPAAAGFGAGRARTFAYHAAAGPYRCQHVLEVAPLRHEPLLPGHTYAVYATSVIRSSAGETPTQDADLASVLGPAAPVDATLARAWRAYANLRVHLERRGIALADVALATSFTVQDSTGPLLALAAAVKSSPAPALSSVTFCDGGTASPCAIAGDATRACGDSSGAFREVHGRVSVPGFQQGTAPFEYTGGEVRIDGGGQPVPTGTVDVCFALTVPKGAAPPGGWPLVVHGHGTGGSFRAAVNSGLAETLAGATPAIATLTLEAIAHGARRGASTRPTDGLVLNLGNPRAARGNHLQGAVDVLQALRIATLAPFDVSGVTVGFDPGRVYYAGHDLGATLGIPAVAVSDGARAVVLSGAGSHLIEGILTRTSPVSARAVLQTVLGDALDPGHPVMIIWQTFFDRIDPLNFDALVLANPPAGASSKHVHLIWGKNDTFSSTATIGLTARTMGLALAEPVVEAIGGLTTVARPVSGNRTGGDGVTRTAACVQYESDGSYDGHLVGARHPAAIADLRAFLTSMAASGTPTVP